VTQKEFIKRTAGQSGYSVFAVKNILKAMRKVMIDEILACGKFLLLGIGTFQTKLIPAKERFLPGIGKKKLIRAHRNIKFSVCVGLKQALRKINK
jgi:nucleoid DNA-binding protein